MNRDSFAAIPCASFEEMDAAGRGAIHWITDPDTNSVATLVMHVTGPSDSRGVEVTRDPERGMPSVWLLSGPKERPTLAPSLDCIEPSSRRSLWHGWLRDGRFVSC